MHRFEKTNWGERQRATEHRLGSVSVGICRHWMYLSQPKERLSAAFLSHWSTILAELLAQSQARTLNSMELVKYILLCFTKQDTTAR
jgi:hypothetical protein